MYSNNKQHFYILIRESDVLSTREHCKHRILDTFYQASFQYQTFLSSFRLIIVPEEVEGKDESDGSTEFGE